MQARLSFRVVPRSGGALAGACALTGADITTKQAMTFSAFQAAHDKAFKGVAVYVIAYAGTDVVRVAIKRTARTMTAFASVPNEPTAFAVAKAGAEYLKQPKDSFLPFRHHLHINGRRLRLAQVL